MSFLQTGKGSRFASQAVVDIHLSCRNLPSGQDPFCVLHRMESRGDRMKSGRRLNTSSDDRSVAPPSLPQPSHEQELGRTEVVLQCRQPDFEVSFRIEYRFEEEQHFCVRCYAEKSEGVQLQGHAFLGGFYFNMGQLLGAVGNTLCMPLLVNQNGAKPSFCFVRASPTKDSSEVLRFQLKAQKLKKDGFFGQKYMNPFYMIQVLGPDRKSWPTLLQSSVARNTQSPIWDIDEISMQKLSDGDYSRVIHIQIMSLPAGGGPPQDIGGAAMSVNELLRIPNTYEVLRANKKGENKPSGILHVVTADILNRPNMVDYITGGCEISLMVAVDFTISNGPPYESSSLHFRSGKSPNEYQQAILKIGGIVENYASNKAFPIWGFGAKINHVKQDCLRLRGSGPGVQGLLDAYDKAFEIPGFDLSGPTHFLPILRAATRTAQATQSERKQCYSVLVILTDGVIADMEQTVDMICRISETAPLSIIIVGVGKADFRKMEMLDSDEGILRDSKGQAAERDIVQFVPFRKYATNSDKLATEVLREIPKQLVGFFQSRNIKPNPPIPMPSFQFDEASKKI